ncbi:polysaccharide lyase 8 family protein [Streptomyces sp. H27-D2]|uniref:polysaccharide lyase 8 family protein n=1 Tax=Streptomyces sp. H27-D2 TaxID=3046304 RepID=UPI002DB5A55F|nr:polysaccharide lyase 8 family protein [Streptomyces sp. H27-D2]MEC4017255.1 polysaccharide lyase 8 family protein [Streptomyces sp. H27-D2]
MTATGASALGLTLAVPPDEARGAGAGGAIGATGPGGAPAAVDEFDTLRRRWLDLLLGTGVEAGEEPYASRLKETGALARQFRASMRPTATSLWPDWPFDPPTGITQAYSRLNTMAQAYVQPGTGLTGDAGLAADIVTGLDHLDATVYHPATTRYGNWWEWQIGSPRLLLDTVALLYDLLGEGRRGRALAAVDHFVPDSMLGDYTGTSTGANRVDLCRVVALRGVLGKTAAKIALARDALSPVFPYVTTGDGLYADGSFIQHSWVAYSGTYGYVLLDGLGRLFTLLADSSWAVTDPKRQIIFDSVEKAYAPLLHNGLMMDSVNGRAISRGYLLNDERGIMRGDHYHGHLLVAAVALLALGAGSAERQRWNGLVKGWIARDTTSPVLADRQFEVGDLARLKAVADGGGLATPERVGHRLFAAMDRAVHRRPGWAANISMASERIAYYENGNGENPRGWHTGAGMLYWWGADFGGGQYTDGFWPTVDWYRLPGTTVSSKRLADNEGGGWGEPKPAVKWVGGASDGEFAAVGQHVKGLASTLRARKSWFCAADTVVCLGAGITGRDGAGTAVETIVDNRSLGESGAARLTVDGAAQPGTLGWTKTFERARWAHLAGHGGYVFPGVPGARDGRPGARLKALRQARTGAWRDINTGSSPAPLTRRYLTLWHDHGTDPTDASYACLLMPGASPHTLAARAADERWLTVLANTDEAQGVTIASLGLTAVNFWFPGTVGPLTAGAPASVLVRIRNSGRTAAIRVSDPMRTGAAIDVGWAHPVRAVVSQDPAVRVLSTGRSLRLRVTAGTDGATHGCEVALR